MDPSPKKKPKPLYKAKNISGLRKTAYKLEKKDIRTLIKDSDELYRKAQGAKSDMDDELSYESFYQYVKIVLHVQKRKEYMDDKKYYNSLVGSIKINSAIQELDRLTDILQKRYENIEVEESVSRPSMTIKPSNGKRSPSLPVIQPIKPVPNEKVSPFKDKLTINANELMQMLNNHQLSLLIMDCRPKSEFAESHLTKPTCLNVPEEIIKKGMSAGKIQSELSLDGRTLWASRSTKDFVVLMDWNSGGANIQQTLLILQHILLNYDPDVQYQNRLLMLEDGYESLKNTYPMCVFNPHYQPPRVLFQFNDGLDNVEYPVLTDIKMKEDNMGDRRQPIIDRSSKEAVLQRERQFVRDKKIEAEKSMFEMLQMEVEFNKTTRIAETLPESDAKIGELLTKKMELGNKIIELEDINQNLDLDITNSLNEQRAVIADAYQDPEDDDFGSSDRVVDEKEAAIIEEQVRLLEELNENRRRVERERKPLAEKREREMTLDIERTRRIEQNNNVVIPPRPVQQPQPSFDRSVKPMFVEEEPPVIRHFNAEPGSEGHGLTGLKNLGNTCYMNSIMQCLSNTPMLKDFFISDDGYRKQFHRTNRSQRAIAEEFSAVIREIWLNKHRHISSNDLRRVIGQCKQIFRGMDQQDSHEFLTILMDWLHLDLQPKKQMIIPSVKLSAAEKAWLEFVKCEESYIMKLFYGQIKSTVKCTICNGESATYEGFSNLSLELPENSKRCSIENCMKMYFYGERISGWNCPSCKAPRDAIKKLDITKLPPILVIHFKRFNVDLESSSNRYTKKQTFVEFPLTGFDVFEYIAPLEKNSVSARNSVYQLYGVSNHYGTMERGHYTAFCKSSYYGKWFKYDDHIVSPMDSSVVTSSAAYILFYTSI